MSDDCAFGMCTTVQVGEQGLLVEKQNVWFFCIQESSAEAWDSVSCRRILQSRVTGCCPNSLRESNSRAILKPSAGGSWLAWSAGAGRGAGLLSWKLLCRGQGEWGCARQIVDALLHCLWISLQS